MSGVFGVFGVSGVSGVYVFVFVFGVCTLCVRA